MAQLNHCLAELGRLAQTFAASIDGIATQDVPALQVLIDKDRALDELEAQIHTKAFEVIAMPGPGRHRFTPRAGGIETGNIVRTNWRFCQEYRSADHPHQRDGQ